MFSTSCRSYHLYVTFVVAIQVTRSRVFVDQEPSDELYFPKYNFYHNLSRLNECIHSLSDRYPDILEVDLRFRSRWGLSQYLIHVTNFAIHSRERAKVLLSFGEHSNEFFPVESMLHLLENITDGYNPPGESAGNNFTTFVLNNIDLYIVAIANPDGRSIVETTKNYCWRHTSNKAEFSAHDTLRSGQDKANNWRITEPECKFLRKLLPKKFDAFVSFHSGQRGISFPKQGGQYDVLYSWTVNDLAKKLAAVVSPGKPPTPVNLTDSTDVSIFSYVSLKKVPFTFMVSLWENSKSSNKKGCFHTFNPESEQLKVALRGTIPFYETLFVHVHTWKKLEVKEQVLHSEGAKV